MSWTEDTFVVFDARALTVAQRDGLACISCAKKWPRPQRIVGEMPDGRDAKACGECADGIAVSLAYHAVRHVLRRAAEIADRYAPDILAALIAAEPSGYGTGPRHAVETAARLVARHLQDTEEIGGQELLPAVVDKWEQAYAWLTAWRNTQPPAAVLQEVLRAVLHDYEGWGRQ